MRIPLQVCNTELTTGREGRCECRRDMRWNSATGDYILSAQNGGSVTDPAISLPKICWVVISTRLMSGECELYLDVDCSGLSYESRPSASVLRAVEDLQRQQQQLSTTSVQQDFGRTKTSI